jgi:fatty acid desaturase
LRHQDAIGLALLVGFVFVVATSSLAFGLGMLPWWGCLIVNAIVLSLVRELEHDLVHNLYFKSRRRIQNLMMAAIWPILGNLPHAWYRREMHLLHHRTSGHDEDFEERLIGNGLPFGPLKILSMIEPGLALLFRKREMRQIPFYNPERLYRAIFPIVFIYYGVLALVVLGGLLNTTAELFGMNVILPNWLVTVFAVANFLGVIWVFPNMIRQISLQVLSSWMHYHGDVDSRLHETQVLNAWYFFPLNLFSANFGSTHAIHHFYANQPFYLRLMVARQAHAAMRQHSVRYNDTASLLRCNRFQSERNRA